MKWSRAMKRTKFQLQRERLVDVTLRRQGAVSESVLQSIRGVSREDFLPEELRNLAYRNVALPISSGQTISQPLIVAQMLEVLDLEPCHKVLEVGAGSGYAAAVMSRLVHEVFTVERVAELAVTAESRLEGLGYRNVHVRHGDGSLGWPEQAPFDAISVAAAGPKVPASLLQQLKPGGRLVMPVGSDFSAQELVCITRTGEDEYQRRNLGFVRFVPLIGQEGWRNEESGGTSFSVVESAL